MISQARGLIAKVQAAQRSMNAGRTGPACNKMDSFLNQVRLLIEAGTLTPTLGQALANAANALKAAFGCPLRARRSEREHACEVAQVWLT